MILKKFAKKMSQKFYKKPAKENKSKIICDLLNVEVGKKVL